MRQPRTDPNLRRQQILEEAIRLIGLQGYNGLTIQDLARRCGLTNGGLLYYFESKERLLIAILENRDRRETAIIHADIEIERTASGRANYTRHTVLQIFRSIVARSALQPELLRFHTVLQAEALNRDHPAYTYFLRREVMVLRDFAKALTGHVDNPDDAARQILALMAGLEQQWLRADMAFDLTHTFEEAIALVLPWAKAMTKKDKLPITP
jgi:AcrR family transcriptional regulator